MRVDLRSHHKVDLGSSHYCVTKLIWSHLIIGVTADLRSNSLIVFVHVSCKVLCNVSVEQDSCECNDIRNGDTGVHYKRFSCCKSKCECCVFTVAGCVSAM